MSTNGFWGTPTIFLTIQHFKAFATPNHTSTIKDTFQVVKGHPVDGYKDNNMDMTKMRIGESLDELACSDKVLNSVEEIRTADEAPGRCRISVHSARV